MPVFDSRQAARVVEKFRQRGTEQSLATANRSDHGIFQVAGPKKADGKPATNPDFDA